MPAGETTARAARADGQPLWLVVADEGDPPPGEGWLTREERAAFAELRVPRRRAEWLLGRWAAKQAVADALRGEVEPSEITIAARADGSPEARIGGRLAEVSISITHSSGRAMAAAADPGVLLGCDLERVEPRDEAFIRGILSSDEREILDQLPARRRIERVTLLWSAKESALKALGMDLRTEPAAMTVDVLGSDPGWSRLRVRTRGGELQGWWSPLGPLVATVVSDPPSERPTGRTSDAEAS